MRGDGTGIFNGRDYPNTTVLQPDVCVIGAGPAGISAAWKLGEAGFKVILLDGSRQLDYPPPLGNGNQDYFQKSWSDKAKLYNGVATGIFASNEPQFLIRPTDDLRGFPEERERVFGGTPVHGGGQCRPQDRIDIEGRVFEGKTVFPKWPITYDELAGFYREASIANYLTGDYPGNFTTEFWAKTLGLKNPIPKLPGFDVEMYQFMGKWQNFATRPWGESQKTIDHFVQVIVNATVTKIVVASGAMNHLEVKSMEDKYPHENPPDTPKVATTFKVVPRVCVLACGAVENARQLLLSTIPKKDKELVGHYFMCHPLSKDDIIETRGSYISTDQLNFMEGNHMDGNQWRDPSFGNTVQGRFITNPQITKDKGIGRCWFWARQGGGAKMYFEMAPNYESYVGLDDDGPRDPVFEQPLTRIHWSLTDTDQRTYEENCNEFQKSVKGRIWYPPWKDTIMQKQWVVNGHHMGTTRMSVNPEEGVVDKNLQVHKAGNLYVAGSSVFPSGGISNPTMTIVALSLRLAAHIQNRLGKPGASPS
jgi:GMC oxidoreductase/Glucose inhibited division protein A